MAKPSDAGSAEPPAVSPPPVSGGAAAYGRGSTSLPGGGRVNLSSLLTGFALGAVLASVAWVQVTPSGGGDGFAGPRLVQVGGEALTSEGDELGLGLGADVASVSGSGSGAGSRGGAAGSAGRAGVDVGGGARSSGPGGTGGSGPGSGPGGTGGTGGTGGSGGTRTGVSDTEVVLGATFVDEGIAEAFLGEARLGMEAVRNRVNSQKGGIHGRTLRIIYKGDGWKVDRGLERIQNLVVQEKVFALAVSPSSEGLNAASDSGFLAQQGVPVVGADGLNNSQFITPDGKPNPWIWPVAAATTTQMHVIMADAWERCEKDPACGKLQPAIVFGNTYRFGREGAFAFNAAYHELSGHDIPGYRSGGQDCRQNSRYCGIEAVEGGKQYTSEINTVNSACAAREELGPCNFMVLLLEPKTALDWMGGARRASYWSTGSNTNSGTCCGQAGAQPLFTRNFARECRQQCDGMVVWTGYNPPIGDYESAPAVVRYVEELERTSSSADRFNQFTMGAYLGMELMVQALDRVGRDLTREKVVETLNTMSALDTGLTRAGGLRWTTSQRYANKWAQAFRISHGAERFDGFVQVSGYQEDRWPGLHNRE